MKNLKYQHFQTLCLGNLNSNQTGKIQVQSWFKSKSSCTAVLILWNWVIRGVLSPYPFYVVEQFLGTKTHNCQLCCICFHSPHHFVLMEIYSQLSLLQERWIYCKKTEIISIFLEQEMIQLLYGCMVKLNQGKISLNCTSFKSHIDKKKCFSELTNPQLGCSQSLARF